MPIFEASPCGPGALWRVLHALCDLQGGDTGRAVGEPRHSQIAICCATGGVLREFPSPVRGGMVLSPSKAVSQSLPARGRDVINDG